MERHYLGDSPVLNLSSLAAAFLPVWCPHPFPRLHLFLLSHGFQLCSRILPSSHCSTMFIALQRPTSQMIVRCMWEIKRLVYMAVHHMACTSGGGASICIWFHNWVRVMEEEREIITLPNALRQLGLALVGCTLWAFLTTAMHFHGSSRKWVS